MHQQTGKLGDSEIARTVRGYQQRIRFMKFITGICQFCIIAGPLIGGLFSCIVDEINVAIAGIAAMPVGIVVGIVVSKLIKGQEKKLKRYSGEHIIKDVVAEKIDIMKYAPDKCINNDFINKCKILPNCDIINGSDYIRGTYKGVTIVYCDLKLEREYTTTDDDGHKRTSYETVFHGHLINLELGQEINGYLRIKERKNPRKEKGFFSDVINGIADVMGIKTTDNTIEVENVEFNNQFEIKTNNNEMAFYILTPQFMENIIKADKFAAGYTNIEFTGKSANITINNGKDSFEFTKIMHSAKALEKSRQQMRDDLNRIISIVDEILAKDKLF